jgi:predicted DsbA family dithiol-disulfide isomerase
MRIEVWSDITQDLGLRGVPYFIFDRKVAIHGAREVAVFEQALGDSVN